MAHLSQSKQRFVQMSHRKLRRVANEVRGKNVVEALNILYFMPYFSAKVIYKNVKNAVSNAMQQYGDSVLPSDMYINQIMIDEGPSYKRFKPRAQGRIYAIMKPTAHILVVVGEKAEESNRQSKKRELKTARTSTKEQ
jgi:large subunit ribosomal protein L22